MASAINEVSASANELDPLNRTAYRDATAASLRSAEAQLSQAEDAAAYGTLLAPREGIILSTQAEPGTLVSPGTAILELVDVLGREAVIDVPTEYVTLLPRRADPGAHEALYCLLAFLKRSRRRMTIAVMSSR